MSDIMLHSVLNMPPELWRTDPLDVMQRHDRYVEASKRIHQLEAQAGQLEDALRGIASAQGDQFLSLDLRAIELVGRMQGLASSVLDSSNTPVERRDSDVGSKGIVGRSSCTE